MRFPIKAMGPPPRGLEYVDVGMAFLLVSLVWVLGEKEVSG